MLEKVTFENIVVLFVPYENAKCSKTEQDFRTCNILQTAPHSLGPGLGLEKVPHTCTHTPTHTTHNHTHTPTQHTHTHPHAHPHTHTHTHTHTGPFSVHGGPALLKSERIKMC